MASLALLETEKDKEDFTLLYQKYNKLVYCIAMEQLKERELAEDCCQEVFLYIAKNFQRIKENSTEESVMGYVSSVTKLIAVDMYRKKKHEVR